MTYGPSNRTLLEALLVILLGAAVAVCAVLATRGPAKPSTPPLTAELALDAARAVANYKQETLAKFEVVKIASPWVRVVVSIPEESMVDFPVDARYRYGCSWYLVRTEPVRGKLPGPG